MSYEIHSSCEIYGIPAESDEGMQDPQTQHSPLVGSSVMELYPDAKPTIGPAIDRGFYYDFAMEPIAESDLKTIQKKMHEIARKKISQLKSRTRR